MQPGEFHPEAISYKELLNMPARRGNCQVLLLKALLFFRI
jgi:hypothetical protein